jgi:Flp pilus assembly protein CpaB
VLTRTRVLAVGHKVWKARPDLAVDSAPSDPDESILVTLLLSPEETARLALANSLGQTTLALASPLEEGRMTALRARFPDIPFRGPHETR